MKFNLRSLLPKRLWYKLTINQRASITISIPLLCVIMSLGTHFWMRQSVTDAQKSISHTNEVLLESRNILISLLKAETSVRGYFITHQTEFLTPYNQTDVTLPENLTKLKDLVQDHPIQIARSQEIEQLAQQKMAYMSEGISLIKRNVPDQVMKGRLKGREIMNKLTAVIQQFDNEELRLLDLRGHCPQFTREIMPRSQSTTP